VLRQSWWLSLLLGPVAYLADHVGWNTTLVFVLAAAGTIPAAGLLGRSTEELAVGITAWDAQRHGAGAASLKSAAFGAKVGGLLNATFGNIPELIVGILALHQGYVTLAKATIIGSIIGNATLVLGLALLVGGLRHGTQRFDAQEAGHHAVLLALAVASLALPSVFLTTTQSSRVTEISVVTGVLLLLTYLAYVGYAIFGLGRGTADTQDTILDEEARIVEELSHIHPAWSLRTSLVLLAVSTLLVFGAAEALIDTVEPVTRKVGWSPIFVGVILVPIIGNVAEHSSAVLLAYKNKMDVALGVSSGSSIQVAVFVTPVLVLLSQLGHQLTLAFGSIELTALALTVALFYLVARDGESTWLEGLQLMILYALVATVFFYVPGQLH
jgi:Ca2+:H+ antiporter